MRYIYSLLMVLLPLMTMAQTMPSLKPEVTYTNPEGIVLTGSYPDDLQLTEIQNAPLNGLFLANPQDMDGWDVSYDWVVMVDTVTGSMGNNFFELVHRFEENLDYDFVHKGTYKVRLKATFTNGEMKWEYPSEDMDSIVFTLQISGSKLEFPNGISPNGDERNDVLKPKDGYKSIVSFHAAVFNRWGKKLYSWDDVRGSWDGKFNGKVVKDGVYFLVVSAKGSDGINYNIKKAINVISGYNNGENESGSAEESE